MKKMLAAGLIFSASALSSTAFAFHCPADMQRIDAALAAKPALSSSQMANVKKWREQGEKQHRSGDHKGSVDTLAKAMKALGIK
jgi:hypothetical protein